MGERSDEEERGRSRHAMVRREQDEHVAATRLVGATIAVAGACLVLLFRREPSFARGGASRRPKPKGAY